jgi:hypothetical protein
MADVFDPIRRAVKIASSYSLPVPRSLVLLALVLATVTLVVEARVILGGKTFDDVTYHTQVAPPRYAAATQVQEGSLPTWWDGTGLGVPLLAEPSHGAAYPLHWLAGTPRSLELLLVLHLFLAALGTALWARKMGASDVAALVCGVLVATSGVAATAALRGSLPALAWLPWLAWAARDRRPALLALFIALTGLAGDLALLIDGVLLALVMADAPRRRTLLALACGLAIACIQWIPAALALPHIEGSGLHGIRVARFLELFVPMRSTDVSFPTIFVGAPLFALAAVTRPSRRMIAFAAALTVASAFWGQHLGVVVLIAAAHAGTAIDALFAADNEVLAQRRRALIALVGASILTAIAVGALGMLRSRIDDSTHRALLDHTVRDGVIAVVCGAGAAMLAWRMRVAATPLVVALLLVAPGVLGQHALLPVTDRSIVDEPSAWVERALTSAPPVRVYRPIKLLEDVRDTTPPTLDAEVATFSGASGSLWGIDAARSEDPARIAVHDRTWFAASSAGGLLLDRYGISLAILPLSSIGQREGTTVELGRRGSWALVRYPASPPAAVVREWIFAPDDETALKRLFPPGARHGLPTGLIVLHGTGHENQDEESPPAPCTIESWSAGAIDLVCTTAPPAADDDRTGPPSNAGDYAVISSTPMPGWSVTVDDRATPWLTADVLRRAVAIPTGTHRVQWRYHAPGLTPALILAALGLLGLVALRVKR